MSKEEDKKNQKLSLGSKLGYASGGLGEGAPYALNATFMLFFLTTVVGMDPFLSGAITSVASVVNVFWNPIIGYISDNSNTRWGKRRPYIFVALWPMVIINALLFCDVGGSTSFQTLYYGILLILFWITYVTFYDVWLAFGSEYTTDYDDRTSIRGYTSIINTFGVAMGQVLPTSLVAFFYRQGISTSNSWFFMAVIISVATTASIMVMFIASKDKDPYMPDKKSNLTLKEIVGKLGSMFAEYINILRIKPTLIIMLCSLVYLIGYGMMTADKIYFLTYNLGMSPTAISLLLLIAMLISFICIPLATSVSKKYDKRVAMISLMTISSLFSIAYKFTGVSGFWSCVLLFFFLGVGLEAFWQLVIAVEYDACDYDELQTGKKRSGIILSMQGTLESIAPGIGSLLLGAILHLAGFDGSVAVQSAHAVEWIENAMLIIPSLFTLASVWLMYKFPIGKKMYNEIREELDKRNSRIN